MGDEKREKMRLVIGGDTVPTATNLDLFKKGLGEEIVGSEILKLMEDADVVLVNLEAPLSSSTDAIDKYGPNLVAPKEAVEGLTSIGVTLCCLANNHIMDYGEIGLRSTIEALDSQRIDHFGAAFNLAQASEPILLKRGNITIGVYACAEHEFSIATPTAPGANPFDPLESLDHIASLAEKSDFVIVLYHGGKEQYRYPSPELQKRCRKIVEKGADLVICQHSHCIGCFEIYCNSTIVYGQGNFIFDYLDNEFWNTGLLLVVDVDKLGIEVKSDISYIPVNKVGPRVRLAEDSMADTILSSFIERSERIQKPGYIESAYKKLAKEHVNHYLRSFMPGGNSLVFKGLDRLLGKRIARWMTARNRALCEENYIVCEAHRELFVAGLQELICRKG